MGCSDFKPPIESKCTPIWDAIKHVEPIEHEGRKYYMDNLCNLYNEDRTINTLAHEITYSIHGKEYLGTELARMIENNEI